MSTGTAATLDDLPAARLADDDHFARDLIDGRWQFPAAPYDFEIRNPADSTVTTVVPLSSRFDVDRAVAAAARAAAGGPWTDPAHRTGLLHALVDQIERHARQLAALQTTETGLSDADSSAAVAATVRIARQVLRDGAAADAAAAQRVTGPGAAVSGHILSWGLPLTEVVTSTLPAMLGGQAVVVKPSLRGALSAVAFAELAVGCGLPPGVLNIVQGTGVDVGAALMSTRDLCALHVHGNARTRAGARRAADRSGVRLHELAAGGNVVVVGPGRLDDADLDRLVEHLAAGARLHAGAFGLPLLALHRQADPRVTGRVLDALAATVAAPLPTEPLRARALARIDSLVAAGAEPLLGGAVPDDAVHRMGWRIPPTVLHLGAADAPAAAGQQRSDPLGPVLSILSWTGWTDLTDLTDLTEPAEPTEPPDLAAGTGRHRAGTVLAWGADPAGTGGALAEGGRELAGGPLVAGRELPSWPDGDALSPVWTARTPGRGPA